MLRAQDRQKQKHGEATNGDRASSEWGRRTVDAAARGRNRQDGSPLDKALAEIARAREKTIAQVGLNWLLSKDERIVAIPGATGAEHLRENVGAVRWTLSDEEVAALEQATL